MATGTALSAILRTVEKRIDENAAPLHLHAASTDPGYIPGITPSKPVAPADADAALVAPAAAEEPDTTATAEKREDADPDDSATPEPQSAAGQDATADDDRPADEGADASTDAGADEGADKGGLDGSGTAAEDTDKGAEEDEAAEDSPSFDAQDHRGSITIDRTGIRFRLDDQEADFDWDEIGAVEHSTSRFGRRLTVTAHTLASRAYPTEVQAPDKATLKRWTTELDDVLDAYFEE